MKDLYKIAHECRNEDSTRYWRLFTVMTAINAALLGLLGTGKIELFVIPWCGIVGTILSFLWLEMLIRYTWWVRYWEGKLEFFEPFVIEEINKNREKLTLNKLPDEVYLFKKRQDLKPDGISTRIYSRVVAIVFIVIWIIITSISTYMLYG